MWKWKNSSTADKTVQPDHNDINKFKRYPGVKFLILTAGIVLAVSIFGFFKTGFFSKEIDIDQDQASLWDQVSGLFKDETQKEPEKISILKNGSDYVMPEKEEDRLDILILGIRGEEELANDETGSYLTDTIMVFSYDKNAQKSSIISIPRDFYVKIDKTKEDKINVAYEIGVLRNQGVKFVKNLVSQITGVYIDQVVVFDFESFKQIVDSVGGVDIYLDKPFVEANQWGYEFSLPAGQNHLDGQNALYYVRSRYSSSDFDRALRQQKVMLAIKEKIGNLNLISDPIRSFEILNTIRKNIHTDINILEIGPLLSLAGKISELESKMVRYAITTENLLYETKVNGIYILLPQGDNFTNIKALFKDII